MVFLGKSFWTQPDIHGLFTQLAGPQRYSQWILASDDGAQIVEHIVTHAHSKGLPLCPEATSSLSPHIGRDWCHHRKTSQLHYDEHLANREDLSLIAAADRG